MVLCSDFDIDGKIARDCQHTTSHHCDLFLNHFDADDKSCPDEQVAGVVNARVKPCLIKEPTACGEFIAVENFNVKWESKFFAALTYQ